MNNVFIKHFFVGFMVSEIMIVYCLYSVTFPNAFWFKIIEIILVIQIILFILFCV